MDTTFGTRLRDLRERRGISQRDLGIAAGISETYVQALEQGRRRRPSLSVVDRLCQALSCRIESLSDAPSMDVSLSDRLRELSELALATETHSIPLRGAVPGEVREHADGFIHVPGLNGEGAGLYALEVTAELTEEGLQSGDYVVIAPVQSIDEASRLYVLNIGSGILLRRAWRAGSRVHMRPGIEGQCEFAAERVVVVGRVVKGGRWRDF